MDRRMEHGSSIVVKAPGSNVLWFAVFVKPNVGTSGVRNSPGRSRIYTCSSITVGAPWTVG